MNRTLLTCLALLAPAPALACGGLFCNATTPVEQAAERILFIADGGTTHMHVQLTYQGPPADFGWLLPAPRGVETGLSSQALFAGLDVLYTPRFFLNYEYGENCDFGGGQGGSGGGGGNSGADAGFFADSSVQQPEPEVQVLSREAVGPYDRVILRAENVEALREWLDDNEFAIPEETDEKLIPYITAGADFVAIRLLAEAQSTDVVPLRLSFEADRAAIPIVPTAVAAAADMGIIVHVLGDQRAIPLNYLHVEINEAAIDWRANGNNYGDVVSQAADEAGGKAFATDYAGPIDARLIEALIPFSERFFSDVAAIENTDDFLRLDFPTRNDPDLIRVFASEIGVPQGVSASDFFQCIQCYDLEFTEIDGAAIAARLRAEVQPVREHLTEQFGQHNYLTRLYSTMSPAEMDLDPVFSFNPDLDEVDNTFQATLFIPCADGEVNEDDGEIRLPDGRAFAVSTEPIERQNGEQMRGQVPAARRIDQLTEAGQPMPVDQMPTDLPGGDEHQPPVGNASGGGCGCDVTSGSPWAGFASLLALCLLAFGRRRQHGPHHH